MSSPQQTKVLVAGASGLLGQALARQLQGNGFSVRATVRNKQAAPLLPVPPEKNVEADFSRPETLKDICRDTDVVIPTVHALLGRGRNVPMNVDLAGHQRLITEAADSGVRHFIYPSIHGAAPDHPLEFFRIKYKVEQILIQSGVPYTILRLPAFMERHAWDLLGKSIMSKGKANIFGQGTNPMNFIAIDDIVAAIRFIMLHPGHINTILTLAGPENLSRMQVCDMVARELNKPVKASRVPIGALRVLAPVFSLVHPGIARIMQLAIATEHSNETLPENYSIARFGMQPTYMRDFIHKMIAGTTSV